MHDTEREEYLSAKDVAALAGVDHSTVRRWTAAGHIPARKNPGPKGAYRYRAADVRAFLDGLQVVGAPA